MTAHFTAPAETRRRTLDRLPVTFVATHMRGHRTYIDVPRDFRRPKPHEPRAIQRGIMMSDENAASVPSAGDPWNFADANARYRRDVREGFEREITGERGAYSEAHFAIMSIIEQLFPNEKNDFCPMVCSSDVAWEVMYALNFHEIDAQAIEARRAETERLGARHESAVATPCAPTNHASH